MVMPVKVGIPRTLLYYYYYPMWRVFLSELGAAVMLTAPSTKRVLDQGLKYAIDEICLPIKLTFGHVLELSGKVDYIFLPRLVSVANREYVCPKFMGLPDMVRHRLAGLPPLIDVAVNLRRSGMDIYPAVWAVGRFFSASRIHILKAYRRSVKIWKRYSRLLERGLLPEDAMAVIEDRLEKVPLFLENKVCVALIGHPYNIYDSHISMNLIQRLWQMRVTVVTAENLSEKIINHNAARLPKRMYWTLGRRMIGAAFHYLAQNSIDGMIHVAAFGCGPDSMTGELIERQARHCGVPFLNLVLDEHTGEAGVATRLEAFLDMVRWRRDKGVAEGGSQ